MEVRARETFNSGATPKPGERQRLPKVLAPIDIEQLGREIAHSARHAQENSPDFLRQRIADLERAGNRTQPDNGIELMQLRAEIAKLRPAAELAAGYALHLREADETKTRIHHGLKSLIGTLEQDNCGKPDPVQESPAPLKLFTKTPAQPLVIPRMSMEVPRPEPAADITSGVSTSEQKILDALASLEAVGVWNPSKTQSCPSGCCSLQRTRRKLQELPVDYGDSGIVEIIAGERWAPVCLRL